MLRDGEMTAGDIAERFNTSHATISHHLKMLRDAKLVLVERNGQNLIYSLNSTVFQDIMAWLLNFLDGSDRHEQ
jgi:ArsR family transcriptional regulator